MMFMAVVNVDNVREAGRFHVATKTAQQRLRRFAAAYVLFMILRYVAEMIFHPERRWLGVIIPVIFHLILAAWCALLASKPTAAV